MMQRYTGEAGESGNRAILIRVRNTNQLARSQGGVATAAAALAPNAIDHEVNSKIAKELEQALRGKGVDAEVKVVEPAQMQTWTSASSPVWKTALIGLGALGASYLALKFVMGKR